MLHMHCCGSEKYHTSAQGWPAISVQTSDEWVRLPLNPIPYSLRYTRQPRATLCYSYCLWTARMSGLQSQPIPRIVATSGGNLDLLCRCNENTSMGW